MSFECRRVSIESQVSQLGISDMDEVYTRPKKRKKKKKNRENRVAPMKTNATFEMADAPEASRSRVVTAEVNSCNTGSWVSERLERKASERVGSRVSERKRNRASERTACRESERTGSRASERAGSRASERTWNRASERTGSRASEMTGSRASERTGSRASERTGSRASERTGSRASERTGSRASERTGSRASERTGSLASERGISRMSERMGSRTSGSVFCERTGSRVLERAVGCMSDRAGCRAFQQPPLDIRCNYRRGSITSVPSLSASTIGSGVTTSGLSSLNTSAAPSVTVSLDVSSDDDSSSLEEIVLTDDHLDSRECNARSARLSAADLSTGYSPSFFGNNNFLVSGNFLRLSSDSDDTSKCKVKRWPLSLLHKRKKRSDQVVEIQLDQTQETSA